MLLRSMQVDRYRAVTLTDIVVAMVLIGVFSGWALSAPGPIARSREIANRIYCASKLRQIGMGMLLYANENRGSFPRTAYKPDSPPTFYTGAETKDPFDKDSTVKPNDVTAAAFLILRTQDLRSDVFICPSTDRTKHDFGGAPKTAQDVANFVSDANLGFSFANPYPGVAAIRNGYEWNNTLPSDFVIAADMNPGQFDGSDVTPKAGPGDAKASVPLQCKANSQNHRGAGQNVLFSDGRVEWTQTPFVGVKQDNIFTVAGADDGSKPTSETIMGSPAWAGDSVLLPAAATKSHRLSEAEEELVEIEQVIRMLPALKQRVEAIEKEKGETAQTRRLKWMIEVMEAADAEARAREAKPK